MAAYHKGYTKTQRKEVDRTRKRRDRRQKTEVDIRSKEVIVWDGEGMKLSGETKPQHYVLFGCSAEPDSPLVISEPTGNLSFEQIADYCLSVVTKHPHALHLGYFFKYDQNMIIQSLHWMQKQRLYTHGRCRHQVGKTLYTIHAVFGKYIGITRIRNGEKVSIRIQDFAPFFASSFVKAYQTLFPLPSDPENWAIVEQGKKDRAVMLYDDMAKVIRYWRAEIIALQELAQEFRDLMFRGEFMLTQWHGPGALANYIRRNYDLIRHEYGGKEENMPTAVHDASRGAYYGGHFEQFKVGYIRGSIYNYDINSAYPYAFCAVPSLAEGGFWRNVGAISAERWHNDPELRTSFSMFHVRWIGKSYPANPFANRLIQPLPHRSKRSNMSYPQHTSGWYWAPEVAMAMNDSAIQGSICEITDGWTWTPADNSYPWEEVIREMYKRRLVLKNNNNPTQMAFKLGPNSMYGKAAQRVGGKTKAPPSHTLPIAGYITSTCRAMVLNLMRACRADSVISVETDGIFTTTAPEDLYDSERFPLSKELGAWDFKQYDNMMLLQNGVYLLEKDGEWLPPKTRGIPAEAVKPDRVMDYLSQCTGESWQPMKFTERESFIGLGTAISRSRSISVHDGSQTMNPIKASRLHCTWVSNTKEIDAEGRKDSKRAHYFNRCRACAKGLSAAEAAHDMVIQTASHDPAEWESSKYELPWMKDYVEPHWILTNEGEEEIYE